MATDASVTGIDQGSWRVTVLRLPKRFSRGAALGFCGGHPAGRAEALRGKALGCWWPAGEPELLSLDGQKDLAASRAGGDSIPGRWRNTKGAMGAVRWQLRDGRLAGTELHDRAYESTWATATGGGAVVGMGSQRGNPRDVGLFWREGAKPVVIAGAGAVGLFATDGTRLAGNLDGHAALWPAAGAAPIDLAPEGMRMSEVEALDGELQIGVAWKGMCARAALWRGTAASFLDLTPKGFESAGAYCGAGGFQAGFVRERDTTRNGSTGCDNRAVLWQGAAERWLDLNALLPAKTYNASAAWAIEIRGEELRICGEASRYEARDPGTARESHFVPVAHPVLWTAKLSA